MWNPESHLPIDLALRTNRARPSSQRGLVTFPAGPRGKRRANSSSFPLGARTVLCGATFIRHLGQAGPCEAANRSWGTVRDQGPAGAMCVTMKPFPFLRTLRREASHCHWSSLLCLLQPPLLSHYSDIEDSGLIIDFGIHQTFMVNVLFTGGLSLTVVS